MSAPMDRSQLVAVGVCEECRFNVCLQSQARPFTSPRFAKNAGATLTGVTPLDNDAGVVPVRRHGPYTLPVPGGAACERGVSPPVRMAINHTWEAS